MLYLLAVFLASVLTSSLSFHQNPFYRFAASPIRRPSNKTYLRDTTEGNSNKGTQESAQITSTKGIQDAAENISKGIAVASLVQGFLITLGSGLAVGVIFLGLLAFKTAVEETGNVKYTEIQAESKAAI